jgi:methylmalonyl-CoA/ethylmalonyl-CoA epimerase
MSTPTHIEHIGIAVKNLEESIGRYEKLLGVACYHVEEVTDQKVKTAFFLVGDTKIELLESTSPDGPVGRFIAERGEGVHHIAYAVPDVRKSLDALKSAGFRLIDQNPRAGAEGMNIAFVHPESSNGVLTEICQKP